MISALVCPHCQVYAQQRSSPVPFLNGSPNPQLNAVEGRPFHWEHTYYLQCTNCDGFTLVTYDGDKVVYPRRRYGPAPNPDLSDDIKKDFNEARVIAQESPRGAAALLRLLLQKLCRELGEKGDDLNTDIGNLVKRGVPLQVQQSLDAVRVIGNNAVHPGEMAIEDDLEIVEVLMRLVNVIALRLLTEPKQVQAVYEQLPESKRTAIEKRDGKV